LPAAAQKTTAEGIAEYRAMLADGNPPSCTKPRVKPSGNRRAAPKTPRWKNATWARGPGVVKGAFVELPRFFADTQRVQDLESRLLTCMEQLQGFSAAEIAKTPFGAGEQKSIESLVAYISAESRDMAFNVPQSHAKEKLMYEVGKKVFYLRGGPYDFSCASCHGEDNKRVRLQDLPNLTKQPGAGNGFGAWPAYRVSSGDLWSMQRRLNDCYRQQRFPFPGYASDATIALGVYMGVNSKGGASIAPALKR
jgi:sulfur-oxidizing protein SoxA